MGRPAAEEPRVRLSLDVGRSVKDRIERLRRLIGSESITEVVRRALAIYETLTDLSMNHGARIVVHYANGREREVLIVRGAI